MVWEQRRKEVEVGESAPVLGWETLADHRDFQWEVTWPLPPAPDLPGRVLSLLALPVL